VIEFGALGTQTRFDVAQTLPISQLRQTPCRGTDRGRKAT
jgi:hypothetical protein